VETFIGPACLVENTPEPEGEQSKGKIYTDLMGWVGVRALAPKIQNKTVKLLPGCVSRVYHKM
jgi:hypothetical protein